MRQSLITLLTKHTVNLKDQKSKIKSLWDKLIWAHITISQTYMPRTGFTAIRPKISINSNFLSDQANTT